MSSANSEHGPDEGEWMLVFHVHGEREEVEIVYEEMAERISRSMVVFPEERFMKPVERD